MKPLQIDYASVFEHVVKTHAARFINDDSYSSDQMMADLEKHTSGFHDVAKCTFCELDSEALGFVLRGYK